MNYGTNIAFESEPLIDQADKKIDEIDKEIDDDRIQPKCFAFKTEIKSVLKYILKECPKFDL